MTGNITFEPIKRLADQPHVKLRRRLLVHHNRGYYTSEYFSAEELNECTQDMLIILRMNIPQIIWKLLAKYNHDCRNKHRFECIGGL